MTNEAKLADHQRTKRVQRSGFWLSRRRDGRSDRWMITWYDPAVRSFRYRSTPETNKEAAEAKLAGFTACTDIVPGERYEAPRDPAIAYFIGGEVGGIKIGIARDVTTRLVTLQCGSPIALRVLATCAGGRSAERAYHARFSAHRLHGEWFERHPDILAEIDRLNLSARELAQ